MNTVLLITYLIQGQIQVQDVQFTTYQQCRNAENQLQADWNKFEVRLRQAGLQDIWTSCIRIDGKKS